MGLCMWLLPAAWVAGVGCVLSCLQSCSPAFQGPYLVGCLRQICLVGMYKEAGHDLPGFVLGHMHMHNMICAGWHIMVWLRLGVPISLSFPACAPQYKRSAVVLSLHMGALQ
jgi:hypothetical protein